MIKLIKSARLIKITKLAAKKVMIKLYGSFNEYAPSKRSIPKIKKNPQTTVIKICKSHQPYFIVINPSYDIKCQVKKPGKAYRVAIKKSNSNQTPCNNGIRPP